MKLLFKGIFLACILPKLSFGKVLVIYPEELEHKKEVLIKILKKKMNIPGGLIITKKEKTCSVDYRFDITICLNGKKKGELTFPYINELIIQKKYEQFKKL